MAYNPFIPQPTDQVSQSQSQILDNFTALEPFGNGFAQLAELTADPTLAANQVGLYAKHVGSNPALFVKNGNTSSVYDISTVGTAASGDWITLPSGVKLQWGSGTTGAGGNVNVTFPTAFSGTGWVVTISTITNTRLDLIAWQSNAPYSTTQFGVYGAVRSTNAAANVAFKWIAIGV
jgi:hypothetical protein